MNFLFISEMLPIDTYASEAVFYRHFIRLANEGHQIHVLTDVNSYNSRKKDLPEVFTIHLLPNRKWFFPPYKPFGMLQKLRFYYYYRFIVKDLVRKHKIETLIGFVYGTFLSPFCAYVQQKNQLPLFSFLHDDPVELHFNRLPEIVRNNTVMILEKSKKVFIASESFLENWMEFSKKFVLLYPIPEVGGVNAVNAGNAIGYSGSVYDELIPALEKVASILNEENTKFFIIGNNEKARYISDDYASVVYKPLFETSKESNEFLVENCSACIIPYPEMISEMPWIKTCFPSKLIQYTLLNIPTIVIAPKESALGKWCLKNNWILFTNTYHQGGLTALLSKIIDNQQVKNQIKFFKEEEFDPIKIHNQFKSYVLN